MPTQDTGVEVANLFDASNENLLTGKERSMLASLLSSSDRVDIAIPENISANELWNTLTVCGRVLMPIRQAGTQLKIIIGRLINLIQKRPEIYESRGFATFDDFMSLPNGLQYLTGISRSELFKSKATATALGPAINMDDVRRVGITKIGLIAGVSEPGSATQKALIEAAKSETLTELKERIARSDMQYTPGDLEFDVLQFQLTKNQKSYVQSFLNNPQVQTYCDSTSSGVILERLVQECEQEWQIRAMVIDGRAE